jgi:hypothetical protein
MTITPIILERGEEMTDTDTGATGPRESIDALMSETPTGMQANAQCSGRKITVSLGNVTVRGEKDGKGKGEARRRRVCLSMCSITENIYYSQLSSVAILLRYYFRDYFLTQH